MPSALTILIASSATIIFLVALFALEDRRAARFGGRLRDLMDVGVTKLNMFWHTSMLYVGGGAVRVLLHRVVNWFLSGLRFVLRFLERRLQQLQRRNKRVVRSVQASRTQSHLSAIEEHRRATALSPAEKEALKEKSLSG